MLYFAKKFLVTSAFSTIIAAVLICLGIYPLYKTVDGGLNKLATLKKEASLAGGEWEKERKTQEAVEALNKGVEKVNSIFINPDVPIDFIQFLEKTAAGNNLSIIISPVSFSKDEDDVWRSIGFQVSLAGSFFGCEEFLKKAEYSHYLLEMENASMQKSVSSSGNLNNATEEVSAALTIKVFFK